MRKVARIISGGARRPSKSNSLYGDGGERSKLSVKCGVLGDDSSCEKQCCDGPGVRNSVVMGLG